MANEKNNDKVVDLKKGNDAAVVEEDKTVEEIDTFLEKSESFVESNAKPIAIGVGVVVLLVIGLIYYFNGYRKPLNVEASEQMFKAEQAFQRDSFALALNGNGTTTGFLSIIDEYGSTDAGNAAKMYAGLCYKQLGDFENAIDYLKKYSTDAPIVEPAVNNAIADCYWELDKQDDAISYYKKAAAADDKVVAPIAMQRMAEIYILKKDKDNAIKVLDELKTKFMNTTRSGEVDKLISIANAL